MYSVKAVCKTIGNHFRKRFALLYTASIFPPVVTDVCGRGDASHGRVPLACGRPLDSSCPRGQRAVIEHGCSGADRPGG